jgi:inorganic pyrophosphatase
MSDWYIVVASFLGVVFAIFQYTIIKKTKIKAGDRSDSESESEEDAMYNGGDTPEGKLPEIYERIMQGALTFLRTEYLVCGIFCLCFSILILILIQAGTDWSQGSLSAIAFIVGALTSMLCGFLGMMIATFSNARTTLNCAKEGEEGYTAGFNTAFRGGAVMGYALCAIGIFVLWVLLTTFRLAYPCSDQWNVLMDCAAGYGLGGSTVAMFGRVGGGIYTKAADVGADLCGKVVAGLDEDDPLNPATIADNVGDNVGDIAGMGADLFGSFAESTCAALVIGAAHVEGAKAITLSEAGWNALMFPVLVSAGGLVVCILCGFVATNLNPVKKQEDIEWVLKVQLTLTAILMLPVTYGLAVQALPEEFSLQGVRLQSDGARMPIVGTPGKAFVCVAMGTIGGLIIGLVTEYFTSHSYTPTRELATACKSGTAVNIIYGLALGYKSCIVPVFCLAATIAVAFSLCDLYGIALAALGMLSTLACGLTIDGFGPISDNAGGIAEMCQFPSAVRERTDALDAAGNTTAAIGKGFAIGSAALVSLALYGAFVVRLDVKTGVNILDPITFAALIVGAMIPYWFAALTMKSVGMAAAQMVDEVKRQFEQKDSKGLTLLQGSTELKPDYDRCIAISTTSSLWEMIAPGALVIGSPLLAGTLFGVQAVFGILTGSLASSVQLAISMSNSGGAWDNCKKFIKNGFSDDIELKYTKHPTTPAEIAAAPKAREAHDAAVQGDTVGDPFKDTSGPALNIVMKLQAIVSLVFAGFFQSVNAGNGLLGNLL